jgi:hypothetical protein
LIRAIGFLVGPAKCVAARNLSMPQVSSSGRPQPRPKIAIRGPGTQSLAAVVASAAVLAADEPAYDLVIRNARVLDGEGNPEVRADIAINEGRFVRIGLVTGHGRREIDIHGDFPRVIAEYVKKRNVLTLEDAVRKMTSRERRIESRHCAAVLTGEWRCRAGHHHQAPGAGQAPCAAPLIAAALFGVLVMTPPPLIGRSLRPTAG